MKNIKYRIPVQCQNGHKAFYHYNISDSMMGLSTTSVPDEGMCDDCPISDCRNCWTRAGRNQLWTQKQDKHDTDIYEDDILSSKNDGSDGHDVWDYNTFVKLVVKWDDKHARFTDLYDFYEKTSVYCHTRIEIIGNTFINPELLEK